MTTVRSATIERLSKEQWEEVYSLRRHYLELGLSTEPADRSRVEAAITAMYARMVWEAPRFLWCDSPATGVLAVNLLKEEGADSLSASLRASLGDSLWASLRDSLGDSLRASLRASLGDSLWASLGDSLRASLRASLGDSLGASLGDSLWDSLGDSLTGWEYGQHDLYWPAHYAATASACGIRYRPEDADVLSWWIDAAHAGWWRPHRGLVICTERPRAVSVEPDPRGEDRVRLHSEDGPALLYRDGWSVHAIHGVRVPARVVEDPGSYTVPELAAIQNVEVRRIAIERFGVRRYLEESGATTVDIDTFNGAPRALVRDASGAQWLIGTDGSTERVYHMSVPDDATTCRDAHVAIAGFDESRIRMES